MDRRSLCRYGHDLCFGFVALYILAEKTVSADNAGLAIGGAWGVKEGWSRQLGENASGKLRLNSILNGATRRGTLLGNSLGVLGELQRPSTSDLSLLTLQPSSTT